jgi:hypothetical protein
LHLADLATGLIAFAAYHWRATTVRLFTVGGISFDINVVNLLALGIAAAVFGQHVGPGHDLGLEAPYVTGILALLVLNFLARYRFFISGTTSLPEIPRKVQNYCRRWRESPWKTAWKTVVFIFISLTFARQYAIYGFFFVVFTMVAVYRSAAWDTLLSNPALYANYGLLFSGIFGIASTVAFLFASCILGVAVLLRDYARPYRRSLSLTSR